LPSLMQLTMRVMLCPSWLVVWWAICLLGKNGKGMASIMASIVMDIGFCGYGFEADGAINTRSSL